MITRRIKELVKLLNNACDSYYNTGTSELSDAEYDYKLEELRKLEKETGFRMSNSPVNKVGHEVISGQNKVKHTIPMLSLEKVHSTKEIIDFSENQTMIAMFKMDGISIRAIYDSNGDIIGLCSRGNGEEGSDLYYQRFSFENLPLHIDVDRETIIDGEAIITNKDFESINSSLSDEDKYSHSRNLTAGSLALLDTNISSKRHLRMIAWDVIEGCDYDDFDKRLRWALDKGFDVVNYIYTSNINENNINNINKILFDEAKTLGYGIDGVVWKYNSVEYGKSKGKTAHHFCNAVAWKNENKVYKTILEDIEWQVSKTGQINPVAKFKAVNLDGAITTKSTLHNLSYIESLELGIGDEIGVIRSNEVIPRVVDNYTRSNTWKYIETCPICGEPTKVVKSDSGTKVLFCVNENCLGKLLGKLELFVSKEGLDIDGLSTSQLQTFIDKGWVKDISDIYSLYLHEEELQKIKGFGKRSVSKLLNAIEASRSVTMANFIRSLGIPLIGKVQAKALSDFCNGDIETFDKKIINSVDFSVNIEGFGEKRNKSIYDWFSNEDNIDIYYKLRKEVTFIDTDNFMNPPEDIDYNSLDNQTFCITGKLKHFSNRDELVDMITKCGGKYVSSVSSKLDWLINNDTTSTSGKNKKMHEFGKEDHIISEEDFLKMIGV